jgi:hypothetical protein
MRLYKNMGYALRRWYILVNQIMSGDLILPRPNLARRPLSKVGVIPTPAKPGSESANLLHPYPDPGKVATRIRTKTGGLNKGTRQEFGG